MSGAHWLSEKELAAQLKRLVSYGATTDKISKLQRILELPNVQARAGRQASRRELALAAEALIHEAALSFHDTPEGECFRLLLALDTQAQRRSAWRRRTDAIRALGVRVRPDTWRTEDGWELAFLQKLARRVIALPPEGSGGPWIPSPNGNGSASRARPRVRAPAAGTVPAIRVGLDSDPRDDYQQPFVKETLRFRSGRIPDHLETERLLRATGGGVERWWEGVNYTVSNDCIDLVVLDQTATVVGAVPGNFDGFRYWEVRLARRLERGDLYQLRACKVVTDREREPLPFFTYIARRSVNRVVVRVEFAADCLPATVTRFVTPTTRVPEVTISSQLVPLDGGVVESVFTDTLEGLSYGFIWRWDEAERSR